VIRPFTRLKGVLYVGLVICCSRIESNSLHGDVQNLDSSKFKKREHGIQFSAWGRPKPRLLKVQKDSIPHQAANLEELERHCNQLIPFVVASKAKAIKEPAPLVQSRRI
jgi:hypothetical protein